jgi:hypothetical protein
MEPLTAGAIAIGTVIATKALEKTGEKVGESLWDKTGQFLLTLKKHSPHTVVAIEKAQEQPLDYGKAVLEVQELAAAAKAETNPKIVEIVNMPNLQKLADKIVNYAQGDIKIDTQHISI